MKRNHWTFHYGFARLSQKIYQRKHPEVPWITKQAILLLEQLIIDSDIGIEFGSGKSTPWLAKRCSFLTSVEHNLRWFQYVSLKIANLSNVKLYHKLLNDDDPMNSDYVSIFKEISDSSIDFIFNDGKYRGIVALKSIDKLKPGGLLIIDDAERYIMNKFLLPGSLSHVNQISDEWESFVRITSTWRRIWTNDGVSCTLIMFKP